MAEVYEIGDIVTLKKAIHAAARTGRSCEWAQISA